MTAEEVIRRGATYFSYGPNLSTQTFLNSLGRGDYDVQSFEKLVQPVRGELKGYRIVFNKPSLQHPGHSEINLELDANGKVEGIVYDLDSETLEYLKKSEPRCSLQTVAVLVNQQEVKCQAFMYDGPRQDSEPEEGYFSSLLRGARRRQLSRDYIDSLLTAAKSHRESLPGKQHAGVD
jgi:hypothetical protein